MKKRNKIIFGIVGVIIFVVVLIFATHDWHVAHKEKEKTAVVHEEEVSEEPELSNTRKALEKLCEERGHENHQTEKQVWILVWHYDFPFFEDSPKEYDFDGRMDLYLTKLEELAEKEGAYDFLYDHISDVLIWNYGRLKEKLSEEACERFLSTINLCKERLETAKVWEEPSEEPPKKTQEENPITVKLTDVRKELEKILNEEYGYNYPKSRSKEEKEDLLDKYNIPFFEAEPSGNSFEERYNSYLDKIEKLAKKRGEWDLLYEVLSDYLIWDYDNYRSKLTEEQCERMLSLIKLCQKRKDTAKTF